MQLSQCCTIRAEVTCWYLFSHWLQSQWPLWVIEQFTLSWRYWRRTWKFLDQRQNSKTNNYWQSWASDQRLEVFKFMTAAKKQDKGWKIVRMKKYTYRDSGKFWPVWDCKNKLFSFSPCRSFWMTVTPPSPDWQFRKLKGKHYLGWVETSNVWRDLKRLITGLLGLI